METEDSQTLLELSLGQERPEFSSLLVRAGARADQYNELLDQAAIHTALLAGHGARHLPGLLADSRNKASVNTSTAGGETALHLAAARGLAQPLKLLLDQPEADLEAKDKAGGRTPLYLAAVNKEAECVRLLVEAGARLDVRCGRSTPRDAIRENLKYFNLENIKVKVRPRRSTVEYLYELLEKRDVTMFSSVLQFLSVAEVSTKRISGQGMTTLQKAAQMGLHKFVTILLNFGVNPNITTEENAGRPVLLAALRGHHETIQCFIDHHQKLKGRANSTNFAVWTRDTKETILHLILKKSQKKALLGVGSKSELLKFDADYRRCLAVVLEAEDEVRQQLSRVINKRDLVGNTPLHYAAQLWRQDEVTALLHLGANIGVRNLRGDIPLSRITPDTLQNFLDSCASHESHPMNEDFKVEFNYSWLAPAVDDYQADEWDEERQRELELQGLPETESLWCMAQSRHHRHLLRHPTVTSFLWLKWQRVRKFFSRNIRLYLLFVTSLTWYIFARFGGVAVNGTENNNLRNCSDLKDTGQVFCHHLELNSGTNSGFWYILFCVEVVCLMFLAGRDLKRDCGCSSGSAVMVTFLSSWFEIFLAAMAAFLLIFSSGGLWYVLIFLLSVLALREMVQVTASLKRYLLSPENILELVMMSLLAYLLFDPDNPGDCQCRVKRHVAALVILLSWVEMIVLVAKHPRLAKYNVYISMFYKVLKTFFSFLLWYSLFLMAFAFGFYIMLHKVRLYLHMNIKVEQTFIFSGYPRPCSWRGRLYLF